jgi:hypothetical protein
LNTRFTVVVFSGEVRSRLTMTQKCLNSINNQTYKNLQKILVNGGSPPHQTSQLENLGVNFQDWTVLDFPIDCMDISNSWSIHRWNGAAALHITEGDYFFAINDDDFIAVDFFSKIASKLELYPDVGAAIGLRVEFDHAREKIGKKLIPTDSYGVPRPLYEPGINVVRELFYKNNLAYGPSLGFQPILKTELIKDIGPNFFYKGFYPDHAAYFQVVSRTKMIFDITAEMYWGIHQRQEHSKWDQQIYWNCGQDKVFKSFMRENYRIFKKYHPYSTKDLRHMRFYYKKKIVSYSLFAISSRYLNFNKLFINKMNREKRIDQKFPFLKHLFILLKSPLATFALVARVLFIKIKSYRLT